MTFKVEFKAVDWTDKESLHAGWISALEEMPKSGRDRLLLGEWYVPDESVSVFTKEMIDDFLEAKKYAWAIF